MVHRTIIYHAIVALILTIILAACGSRPSDNSTGGDETQSGSADSGIVAMPNASFNSVGDQSGITTTTDVEAPVVNAQDDEPDLSIGERVYANKCADCHGSSGEGTSDKGSAIAGLTMGIGELEDLMRTGGDLGPEHLFGTRDVSANGLEALHAYLQSLSN